MMRARPASVGCAIALWAATPARADDPIPPLPDAQPQPASSRYLLSADRFLEVNVGATLQLDWNGLAGVDGPTAHAGAVVGGEIGIPFYEQRLRPALFSGVKLGAYADEKHEPFAFVEGARFRYSPFMWDVFDIYAVARTDVDLDPGASTVLRPGLGVGVRVARLLAVEATWDVMVPIDSTFIGTRHPSFVPYGISFGVLFDSCFKCNRAAPPQVNRDLACRLYTAAAAKKAAHGRICDAVRRAMTATPDPIVASRDEDGTSTFLKALAAAVTGQDEKAEIGALVELHGNLLAQWARYEELSGNLAQNAQRLQERWTYAPVPAELRSYFGCDADAQTNQLAAPACNELTK
jgi:hypothetical protein